MCVLICFLEHCSNFCFRFFSLCVIIVVSQRQISVWKTYPKFYNKLRKKSVHWWSMAALKPAKKCPSMGNFFLFCICYSNLRKMWKNDCFRIPNTQTLQQSAKKKKGGRNHVQMLEQNNLLTKCRRITVFMKNTIKSGEQVLYK